MTSFKYRGWIIYTRATSEGILAELVDPEGRRHNQPRILVSTADQALLYAQKCIQWLSSPAFKAHRAELQPRQRASERTAV